MEAQVTLGVETNSNEDVRFQAASSNRPLQRSEEMIASKEG
jgi:hypothetical protein